MSLRGWSLEYILGLTYRQVGCLWERYWKRKTWEIEVGIKTNPRAMGSGENASTTPTIDATTDAGVQQMAAMGFPVKRL